MQSHETGSPSLAPDTRTQVHRLIGHFLVSTFGHLAHPVRLDTRCRFRLLHDMQRGTREVGYSPMACAKETAGRRQGKTHVSAVVRRMRPAAGVFGHVNIRWCCAVLVRLSTREVFGFGVFLIAMWAFCSVCVVGRDRCRRPVRR